MALLKKCGILHLEKRVGSAEGTEGSSAQRTLQKTVKRVTRLDLFYFRLSFTSGVPRKILQPDGFTLLVDCSTERCAFNKTVIEPFINDATVTILVLHRDYSFCTTESCSLWMKQKRIFHLRYLVHKILYSQRYHVPNYRHTLS